MKGIFDFVFVDAFVPESDNFTYFKPCQSIVKFTSFIAVRFSFIKGIGIGEFQFEPLSHMGNWQA